MVNETTEIDYDKNGYINYYGCYKNILYDIERHPLFLKELPWFLKHIIIN